MNSGTNGEIGHDALELIEQLKARIKSEDKRLNAREIRNMLCILAGVIVAAYGAFVSSNSKLSEVLVFVGVLVIVPAFISATNFEYGLNKEKRRALSDEELAIIATLPAEMLVPMKVYLEANGRITASEVLSAVETYQQHVADRERRSLPGFQQIIAKSSATE